VNIKRLVNSS